MASRDKKTNLMKIFEKETGKNAFWDGKVTKKFKEWKKDYEKRPKRIKIEAIKVSDQDNIDFTKPTVNDSDDDEFITISRISRPEVDVKKVSKAKGGVKKTHRKTANRKSIYTKQLTEVELDVPDETMISVNVKPKKIVKKKVKKIVEKKIIKPSRTGSIYIKTLADKVFWEVQKGKKSITDLSNKTGIEAKKIEEWAVDMEEEGLIRIDYPTNILASPRLIPKKKVKEKKFVFSSGRKIDSYDLMADNVPSSIQVLDVNKNVPVYEIIIPIVDYGTTAIINQLRIKISEEVDVTSDELLDPRMMTLLKDKFMQKAIEKVNQKFPKTEERIKKILAGIIVHNMYGLKDVELLMSDDDLEEISINGSDYPIAVYHKKHGWCITNLIPNNEEEILNFSSSIGRKVGKSISLMNPLLDAHLITGDRVQSTLFPISNSGNTITIRKFSRNPWTFTQYIDNKTIDSEVAALLWLGVQYELSIMIAGGTASGKTSALNALSAFIPPNQRVISIEDVREIALPKTLHWNWVPMTVREARNEGAGNVSMLDLMVTSLRMRPDRIIVGEVRRKKQAETLFEAINTGHSVYTTLHADTAEQAYIRLVEEPIAIPKSELEGLHLLVIMFRDRRKGFRKLSQVAEIMPIPGDIGERDIKINLLYRWSAKEDKWEKYQDSERVINEIMLHTGMNEKEIKQDLADKEMILEWMVKHKIFNIDGFGKIIDEYYQEPDKIIKLAKKNGSPSEVL